MENIDFSIEIVWKYTKETGLSPRRISPLRKLFVYRWIPFLRHPEEDLSIFSQRDGILSYIVFIFRKNDKKDDVENSSNFCVNIYEKTAKYQIERTLHLVSLLDKLEVIYKNVEKHRGVRAIVFTAQSHYSIKEKVTEAKIAAEEFTRAINDLVISLKDSDELRIDYIKKNWKETDLGKLEDYIESTISWINGRAKEIADIEKEKREINRLNLAVSALLISTVVQVIAIFMEHGADILEYVNKILSKG